MTGRTVLITGSTDGIGKESARRLAHLGASVVLVGRDRGRADEAVQELRSATGNDRVEAFTADVTRQADLRRLVEDVLDRHAKLDVLINNATANRPRRELTEDGVETVFAANVLAPFILTRLLTPALRASALGRVVNMTGGVPKGAIDPDNLQGEKSYIGKTETHYVHCKRILMALSYELSKRLPADEITVNVTYPGQGYTPANRAMTFGMFPLAMRPMVPLLKLIMPIMLGPKAIAKASRSSAYLASSDEVEGVTGKYFDRDCKPAEWPDCAVDERIRDTVWRLCEKLDKTSLDKTV
jgi:NAD(P)-dependent dehydrogenase (short-subunit alcohol dehydrogenase family)